MNCTEAGLLDEAPSKNQKEIKATDWPHKNSTKRERQEMDHGLKTAGTDMF